jgi:predicted dehydrogenase
MDKIGFGVIGAGLLGDLHAQVYHRLPGVELVAVADVNAERAGAVAQKYAARPYTDYAELLKRPDIQAVSIATPDFAHRDIAVAAAQAGKHILCEKPLAMSVAEAEDIVAAAKQANVKLMVAFANRVNPPFAAAKEKIKAGQLGRPAYGYVRLSNTLFVPHEMLSWSGKSSALWFLGSHTVDLMRFLLNDEPVRVYAASRANILKSQGIDTQDFHVAILEFKQGAVATSENAWILPRSQPMVYDFKLELLGSEGAIYVDTSHHRALELHTGGHLAFGDILGVLPAGKNRVGGFGMETIARFVDAVLYDEPLLATGEDGLAVTRVLCAIEESVKTRQPVDL